MREKVKQIEFLCRHVTTYLNSKLMKKEWAFQFHLSHFLYLFFIIHYYSSDYYLVMCFKQGLESMMPKVATKISSEAGKSISLKYLWTILAHVLISLTQEDLYPFQSRINRGFYVFISRFLDRLMQLKKIKIPPQKASSWWVVSNCS